jgi:hypothetical protein
MPGSLKAITAQGVKRYPKVILSWDIEADRTVRIRTPAMEAKVTNHVWTINEIIGLM